MALASISKALLGCIAFLTFWMLAVFPALPFLPIGRTAGSLLGAILMVIFQVLSPSQAYAAVDLPILGFLFGTMVVSVYLERADMFKHLGHLLSWRSRGGRDLLCRVSFLTAIASAFFTNDTCCVVLTEFVLNLCRQHNLPPQPFLLALASSANIGSSSTPIGNPQNLVIAIQSKIPFGKFVAGLFASMVVGVLVNTAILLVFYWNLLSAEKEKEEEGAEKDKEEAAVNGVSEENVKSHRFSPATLSYSGSPDLSTGDRSPPDSGHSEIIPEFLTNSNPVEPAENTLTESRQDCVVSQGSFSSKSSLKVDNLASANVSREGVRGEKWKEVVWKTCVYLVSIGMVAALICGLDMSWTAITAAIALVLVDFRDARPSLDKVSYSLLVFFSGMFITVDGFNKTGIPSELWSAVEQHARIDNVLGLVTLSVAVVGLSNLVSNVPTVLLLGSRVAASAAASGASVSKSWLILAWVSTVAGNLTLVGSAANLIVCEQARSAQFGYNLSFWSHLRFGIPSTLIVVSIGLLFIRS